MLTPDEVAELVDVTHFTPSDVQALYRRFRVLDRKKRGYLTETELKLIPELSMNPLCTRIIALFDVDNANHVNFSTFVRTLSVFHAQAPADEKMRVAFDCYDVDGDGEVSIDDLFTVLSSLVGDNLSEADVLQIATRTIKAADTNGDGVLDYDEFAATFDADVLMTKMSLPEPFKEDWEKADE